MTNDSDTSDANSTDKMPSSGDTINVLPILSDAKAPVSVTLTIDKSIKKVAAWVMAVMITSAVLIGAGCVLAIWMIIAYRETEREVRLQRLETDEMNVRLELARIPKHQPGDSP
jgi:hypothetical protein